MYGRSSKRTLVCASGGSFDLTFPVKRTGVGDDELPGDG